MDSKARAAIECSKLNLKLAVEEGEGKYRLFQNQSHQGISSVLLILIKSFWDIATVHSLKNWICTNYPLRIEGKASYGHTRVGVRLGSTRNEFCLIQPLYFS